MAKTDKTITFTNGTASNVTLPVGTYTLKSSAIPGYIDGTIPEFTITSTTTDVALAITAQGTLSVTVTDDTGVKITTGTLQLSNQTGATPYGNIVTITDGAASFANVPYSATGNVDFYIDQLTTDSEHTILDTPQAVEMLTKEQSEAIENNRIAKSFNFTIADAVYSGITPLNGDITING